MLIFAYTVSVASTNTIIHLHDLSTLNDASVYALKYPKISTVLHTVRRKMLFLTSGKESENAFPVQKIIKIKIMEFCYQHGKSLKSY